MNEDDLDAIRAAVEAGREVVKRTPVVPCVTLSEMRTGSMCGSRGTILRRSAAKQRHGYHP